MRKVLRIAWRDYKAAVCTKGFIVTLVVVPLLMCGGGIVMALMEKRVDTREKKVAVLDRSGLLTRALEEAAERRNSRELHDEKTGKQVRPAYAIEAVEPDEDHLERQKLELSERTRRRELHAFVVIGKGVLHPRRSPEEGRVAYHSENAAMDDVRQWVGGTINDALHKLRLKDAGIAESTVEDLFDYVPAEGFGLVSEDTQTGKIQDAKRAGEIETVLLPMIPVMLLLLLVMLGAMPQIHSVTEEKACRVAEVMLGCVRPFQFMMGKLVGGAAVSFTGACVYAVVGFALIKYQGLQAYVPYAILPWFLAYMVFSIYLFGALLAALGSACNDATETQSVMLPAMLPIIIPMLMIMPVIKEPNGALATGLSLFPLFTPFLMLLRLGTPAGIPAWQPWLGLAGVALTAVFFVWAGGRIFRVGLLMHGAPPKLKNIVRWAVRG
jgi:ABC-2 type transport system permease protein